MTLSEGKDAERLSPTIITCLNTPSIPSRKLRRPILVGDSNRVPIVTAKRSLIRIY